MDRFEELARTAEPVLFRVAYRLTGSYEDARDLLQDGLVEAYQAFDRYRPDGRFERWVIRIMTNTYIDGRRRKSARPQTVSLGDMLPFELDDSAEIDLPDGGVLPEQALLAWEFRAMLDKALLRIPDEYRIAMILCDMEELSYAEAAKVMGCPEGTVRSRLFRARQAIRRLLAPYLSDYEPLSGMIGGSRSAIR